MRDVNWNVERNDTTQIFWTSDAVGKIIVYPNDEQGVNIRFDSRHFTRDGEWQSAALYLLTKKDVANLYSVLGDFIVTNREKELTDLVEKLALRLAKYEGTVDLETL